jgi:hypothetical protein
MTMMISTRTKIRERQLTRPQIPEIVNGFLYDVLNSLAVVQNERLEVAIIVVRLKGDLQERLFHRSAHPGLGAGDADVAPRVEQMLTEMTSASLTFW